MASLLKRGKYYWAQWYEGGRPRRKSLRTTSVQRARVKLAELEANLEAGKPVHHKANISIAEFSERFAVEYAREKRPHTVKGVLHTWGEFVAWAKPVMLGDVTQSKVAEFKGHLLDCGRAESTTRTALLRLSGVFTFAIEEMHVLSGDNPCKGVRLPKPQSRDPFYLTREQVADLLDTAWSEPRWRDVALFISVSYYLGLRRNEAVNMRWEWIDWERDTVRIQSFGKFRTKSGASRTVSISPRLRALLEPFRVDSGYVCYPEKAEKTSATALRIDPSDAFGRVVKAAGLDKLARKVTPHVLRHSFGSILAIEGESLYKIQKLLGHTDAKTTQIYAHLQERDDAVNHL